MSKQEKKRSGSPGKQTKSSSKVSGALNLINDLEPNVFEGMKNTSTVCIASQIVDDLYTEAKQQINLIETMKKLPEFNVIFSIDMVS